MKLHFIAEEKDWKIFGIWCILLLYIVPIVLLNVTQFLKVDLDHMFYGFNPMLAYSKEYIGTTILFYIIAVIASFYVVRESFISFDEKKSKGYSRWLSEGELKKELKMVKVKAEKADYGGIPLINNGRKMWVDDGEGHNIIIGSTGAGKTQVAIFPLVHSLAKHDESMIITDPKGEI